MQSRLSVLYLCAECCGRACSEDFRSEAMQESSLLGFRITKTGEIGDL